MSKKKETQDPGWKAAPDVREIAERLILTTPEHQHLAFCKVVYLFNRKVEKVRGAEAFATASKVTGRNAHFLVEGIDNADYVDPESCFVVSVWESAWNELSDPQREALVDHKLCHCKVEEDEDGNGRLYINPHDIEEFHSIVQRHGTWRPDLASFVRDAQVGQKRLDMESA